MPKQGSHIAVGAAIAPWLAKPPFVIAEAGVNHNGSLERALAMVDAAAAAGADAVKFQTFRTRDLVSRHAAKADYQARNTGAGSQFEMLAQLELGEDEHRQLKARAERQGITFLSSPFDGQSLAFLAGLGVPALKLGSGELTNAPLLLQAAKTGLPVILSTGMGTLEETRLAVGALAHGWTGSKAAPGEAAFLAADSSAEGRKAVAERLALLHCTSNYPADPAESNLRAMATLREEFGVAVGYSDHTRGDAVALAAVALGACILEKHFTLDRHLPGPDHAASATPDELAALAKEAREVHRALGSGSKQPADSELPTRVAARRSLTASRAIRRGERFSEDNLAVKRPGNGISPMRYWEWLGKPASRDYAEDECIE